MTGRDGDFFHPVELNLRDEAISTAPKRQLRPVAAWHVDASPALVVRHALATLFGSRYPDLVISGINYGENMGNNIMISGTVGAAFQGAAQGIPALALSRQTDVTQHFTYEELDWTDSERVTRDWTRRMLAATFRGAYRHPEGLVPIDGSTDHPGSVLPFDVLKIDIPAVCPVGTEERFTRLSRRHYFMSFIENPRPDTPIGAAQTRVDIDVNGLDRDDDIYAVAVDGVISITPLHMDNTASVDAARSMFTKGVQQ
jgi:5'-nucleotidase